MPQASYHFPQGFLWGTATSSHQVEGQNTNNNWFEWERRGKINQGHTSGPALDWWNGKWEEDLDRAAAGGQNAHRFSVEWSRVQPQPGVWDEQALKKYRRMAQGMYDRGITPVVTLHHFTNPLWLEEMGGWENPEVIPLFGAYAQRIVSLLGDYVTLWCTFNEPNVYAVLAYLEGSFPPGKENLGKTFQVIKNLAVAHAAAYHRIHEQQYEARVGLVIHYRDLIPERNWYPPDRLITWLISQLFHDTFPSAACSGRLKLPLSWSLIPDGKGTQDFLGLNYYTREVVRFSPGSPRQLFSSRSLPKDAPRSETEFISHSPEGFYRAMKWALQFDIPLMITENGVDDSSGSLRPRYLAEHIHQMGQGIDQGWPIKGYFHWTLVDNFEWERGWTQKFGLWSLDRTTGQRHKRPSAELYQQICRRNQLSASMVEKYAPQSLKTIFPDRED